MQKELPKIVQVVVVDSVVRVKLLVVEVAHVDLQETQLQRLVVVDSNHSRARVFRSADHDQNHGFKRKEM